MIDDFKIFPGDHCGSVAMRGLLSHYCDLALPEAAVFGLGAGLASGFINNPGADPSVVLFGRTMEMEVDLAKHLGIDYRETTVVDNDEAWRLVREEVINGRPTMLVGDIFYLDYRDYKVNFPSHRFVLVGFDDEEERVYIGDRINDTPEVCSLGAVRESRNPATGRSDQNRWGCFHDTAVSNSLADAAESAIRQCAEDMLNPKTAPQEFGNISLGVKGARDYAEALPKQCGDAKAKATASFNAACIEKFGNGGGNFRRLYAGFLEWARDLDPKLVPAEAPALATSAADQWTAASAALFRASDEPELQSHWDAAGHHVARAADLEERLFIGLAKTVG